jgi:hypothetical protein
MTSNYIRSLALKHADLDRRIEAAMKAPLPDTLEIMRLKKLKLACRDSLREAISRKRRRKVHRPAGLIAREPVAPAARTPHLPGEA